MKIRQGGNAQAGVSKRSTLNIVLMLSFLLLSASLMIGGILAFFTASAKREGDIDLTRVTLDFVDENGIDLTSEAFETMLGGEKLLPGTTIEISDVYIKNSTNRDVYSILRIQLDLYEKNATDPTLVYEKWTNYAGTEITSSAGSADSIATNASLEATTAYTIPWEIGNEYQGGKAKISLYAYAIQKDHIPPLETTSARVAAEYLMEDFATEVVVTINGVETSISDLFGRTVASVSVVGVTTDNS